MALRYGYARMGSWTDVVAQYGKDAVGGAAKAVAGKVASKVAGKSAPPPKPQAYKPPPAKKTQWGKIALIGGGIVAALVVVGKVISGRRGR